jgi:hypothetical protein
MSVQRLHAFEKTSIQLRHTLKRLEVFADVTKNKEEKDLAEKLLNKVKEIRAIIPEEYQDVDIRENNRTC